MFTLCLTSVPRSHPRWPITFIHHDCWTLLAATWKAWRNTETLRRASPAGTCVVLSYDETGVVGLGQKTVEVDCGCHHVVSRGVVRADSGLGHRAEVPRAAFSVVKSLPAPRSTRWLSAGALLSHTRRQGWALSP